MQKWAYVRLMLSSGTTPFAEWGIPPPFRSNGVATRPVFHPAYTGLFTRTQAEWPRSMWGVEILIAVRLRYGLAILRFCPFFHTTVVSSLAKCTMKHGRDNRSLGLCLATRHIDPIDCSHSQLHRHRAVTATGTRTGSGCCLGAALLFALINGEEPMWCEREQRSGGCLGWCVVRASRRPPAVEMMRQILLWIEVGKSGFTAPDSLSVSQSLPWMLLLCLASHSA